MNKGLDLVKLLAEVTGEDRVLSGDAVPDNYGHDEALTARAHKPLALVRPRCTEEVRSILSLANEHHFGVTARGSGTGLSGAAIPSPEGVLVSFELMDRVLEVDTVNHVAVVQPGVTLAALDEATAAQSLVYQVFPGETSASLGGKSRPTPGASAPSSTA